jgi:hypothetical protein
MLTPPARSEATRINSWRKNATFGTTVRTLNRTTLRGEMAHFDWFLDSHPEIRSDLMEPPELASRDFYLDHHPELREFLQRHPMVRE